MPYRAERRDAEYKKRDTKVHGAQITARVIIKLRAEVQGTQSAASITIKGTSKNSFWRSKAIIRTTLKPGRESVTMPEKKKQSSVKVPVKLYRIGEVVDSTPFSRQTIHNYTTMGLIEECSWTKGGHRLYDESVFERLSMIVELRKTKTLEQIKGILKKR